MNDLIHTENLEKTFFLDSKEIKVLRGVEISIKRGEIVCIYGASGAGKSTLLHLLGLLDTPSGGKIFFNDVEVSSLDSGKLASLRNRKIGFVFQFHHLLPEFTALENVAIPAMIARQPVHKAHKKAIALLEQLGLGDRIDHKPGELSGGEQQRVAVARAMINDPELILADEPTGNLDSASGDNIHQLLAELNKKQSITMVIVTHNVLLSKIANRILQLTDGQIHLFDPNKLSI